jgi:hypothetical protein
MHRQQQEKSTLAGRRKHPRADVKGRDSVLNNEFPTAGEKKRDEFSPAAFRMALQRVMSELITINNSARELIKRVGGGGGGRHF